MKRGCSTECLFYTRRPGTRFPERNQLAGGTEGKKKTKNRLRTPPTKTQHPDLINLSVADALKRKWYQQKKTLESGV